MFKKLWLIALSTIVLWSPLFWIASASESVVLSWSSSSDVYTPSTITFNQDVVLDEENFSNISCSDGCTMIFNDYWTCNLDYSDSLVVKSSDADNCSLSAWTYQILRDDWDWFASITLTYGSSSSWGSDSDWSIAVPSWFTDSVNWLVSNFAWSIWNYAPTLIIIWLGVVLLFTFWWVIRSWAVRILSKKWR